MAASGVRLAGVKALITDADSALSLAIASAFGQQGADIALLHFRPAHDLADARRALESAGRRRVLFFDADLSAPEEHDRLVERIARELGGIDVLVTNTAFEWQHDVPDENDVTTLERAFRTGLESAFQLSQLVSSRMNDGGSIIITAPMRYAHPVEPVRALAASTHAVANLTASLAQGLAKRRIRVNTIVPGPVRTPQMLARLAPQDAARFGEETLRGEPARPEDLAPAYVFLAAAAESGFVNGTTLEVTGGAPAPVPALK